MLPARKGGQKQVALKRGTENVQLWHQFLARGEKSDTFEIWYWELFCMETSILVSEKTLYNVECYFIASHIVEYSELQLTISS
jgi:hypothetical protein